MKVSVVGFPRIGANRELKRVTESYFKGQISQSELLTEVVSLRNAQWKLQRDNGVDFISSNDYSLYDMMLDTAFMVNAVSHEVRESGLDEVDQYFSLARGHQKNGVDIKALRMKKWFDTNYHYIVPEIDEGTEFKLAGSRVFEQYDAAKALGIETKPVLIGPYTFLQLASVNGTETRAQLGEKLVKVYQDVFTKLNEMGVEWVQMDEPALVRDQSPSDKALFAQLYDALLPSKGKLKVLLQTYFGDIRDSAEDVFSRDFDGIGLDFSAGSQTLNVMLEGKFPADKLLFFGIVNGRNIWANDFKKSLSRLRLLDQVISRDQVVLSTSCSLLHVPYTSGSETKLDSAALQHMAFAYEKLGELQALSSILSSESPESEPAYIENVALHESRAQDSNLVISEVREKVANLSDADFTRPDSLDVRNAAQQEKFSLPLLPTTTIGSFPQTLEVRQVRRSFKNGEISEAEYDAKMKTFVQDVVKVQEDMDLDVLVHGEFERNDMVEYFGENLSGFLFTQNGWVQSYGTRGVKPPIIFSDVTRERAITVKWSSYAQTLSERPMKGMLTGPVTILNWSFPREDISLSDIAFQIGLAIKDEVMDLEANGIKIIQIDEAALREKLPLRQVDWHSQYLDWAIKSFRLVQSSVAVDTQIHTHMCYSEFSDIIKEIEDMNVDVITFEAARSQMELLDSLREVEFKLNVGPGVYDIHSPRVPSEEELECAIRLMVDKLDVTRLWINPDCGLKTRGMNETVPSLEHMVRAAKAVRESVAVAA